MQGATDGEDLHQNRDEWELPGDRWPGSKLSSMAPRPCSGLSRFESQQVSAASVDEPTWQACIGPVRARWEHRATDPTLSQSQRDYARKRAGRLKRAYEDRTARCAKAGVIVKCACPGKREVRWYTCRQHLVCDHCRVKRGKKQRARIRSGLEGAWEATPDKQKYVMLMLTPTARHTDDFATTIRAVEDGWRAFYKRMNELIGWFPFVWTKEITPGWDGRGHPHMHIVAIWPRFDWKKAGIHELWRASCPSSSHLHIEVVDSPKKAAWYIGKYVSKGVETDDFSPELRARVAAGMYGTRWLGSSRRFFLKFVPCCPGCGQSVQRVTVEFPWGDDDRCPRTTDDRRTTGPPVGTQLAIETLSETDKRPGSCGS